MPGVPGVDGKTLEFSVVVEFLTLNLLLQKKRGRTFLAARLMVIVDLCITRHSPHVCVHVTKTELLRKFLRGVQQNEPSYGKEERAEKKGTTEMMQGEEEAL